LDASGNSGLEVCSVSKTPVSLRPDIDGACKSYNAEVFILWLGKASGFAEECTAIEHFKEGSQNPQDSDFLVART
jgi:hypothetical protein